MRIDIIVRASLLLQNITISHYAEKRHFEGDLIIQIERNSFIKLQGVDICDSRYCTFDFI